MTLNEPRFDLDQSDRETTVHEAFERVRRLIPSNPFLHIPALSPGGPQEFTYQQAGAAVDEIISLYREAGYHRHHHVALLLESRADFYLHWLALNNIGATLVPIGSDLVEEETSLVLQHGEVDLVICLPSRLAAAQRAANDISGLQIACLESSNHALPRARKPRSAAAIDSAAIVFTSGSTGRPKGCMLSNEYFLTFGRWYRDMGGRCALRPGRERFITPLPPNHVNALAFSSMGAITTGGCIVQLDRFRSDQWWEVVRQTHATVMHYLGVMPGMLLKLPREPKERQHDLRFGIGGGVRGTDHQLFEERFGVPLLEAWAMTETGGAGTISTHRGPRHVGTGCIGQPSPKYSEACIVDAHGNPLPLGSVGELVVRATGTDPRCGYFSGYYRDPEATASVWREGWLHSGDLARQDEAGSIFFVGRGKQIIRRSGENISAAEVEAVLAAIDHMLQVAVVAVADELREEEVFACVVTDAALPPTRQSAEEVLRQAAKRISYFKLPGYVAFVPTLPTTATQKLRYGAIIELAHGLLSAGGPHLFDVREAKRSYRAKL
jgi:acyl-CoA synthetase (AMP-forming)/AMP-acid ligase II